MSREADEFPYDVDENGHENVTRKLLVAQWRFGRMEEQLAEPAP